jgi:hypothetical protein
VADFSFYASDRDRTAILDAIANLGDYSFIPDREYATGTPEICKTRDATVLNQLSPKRNFYISGPYSKEPPFMGKAGPQHYYVDQSRGGPLIRLVLPLCREYHGRIWLGSGSLFRPAAFWDDKLACSNKPSEELESHYKRFRQTIKRFLRRRKIRTTLWIGVDALSLLDKREAVIANGWWLEVDGTEAPEKLV